MLTTERLRNTAPAASRCLIDMRIPLIEVNCLARSMHDALLRKPHFTRTGGCILGRFRSRVTMRLAGGRSGCESVDEFAVDLEPAWVSMIGGEL